MIVDGGLTENMGTWVRIGETLLPSRNGPGTWRSRWPGFGVLVFRPLLQLPVLRVNLVIDVSALFHPLCCCFHSLRTDPGVQESRLCVGGCPSQPFHSQMTPLQGVESPDLKMVVSEVRTRTQSSIQGSPEFRQLQVRILLFFSSPLRF